MAEDLSLPENEVTVEGLVTAYSDILDEADRVFLRDADFELALSYLYGRLLIAKVEDPEADMIKRGILRQREV